MEEEEDDFYASNGQQDVVDQNSDGEQHPGGGNQVNMGGQDDEEQDEDDDDSESDIDIITERNDLQAAEPASKFSAPRTESAKPTSVEAAVKAPTPGIKNETVTKVLPSRPGSSYPAIHSSTIDIDADPIYEPVGKPISEVDIDADLVEHDKPWRRPGADQSDYFNYGFDEFTWATYCMKQKAMKDALKEQKSETAKFEMMMAGMPGMPTMPGMPAAPSGSQSMNMPGMPEPTPEMMTQMYQQMMAQGITDPSQLDINTFMQYMGGAMGGGAQQGQGQNFMQQGQNQQQMGYGYQMNETNTNTGRGGGNFGRGRGGRRW